VLRDGQVIGALALEDEVRDVSREALDALHDAGERGGPRCGSQPAPARNAFYCPAGDFIAWDETGLMIPYYVQADDYPARQRNWVVER
jgi:hypothetical protein